MEYVDCKLTITIDKITKAKKVKYEVAPSLVKQDIEGELCDDELTKLTVERLNRFVGGNTEFCENEDLRLLGLHLYHILFGGRTTVDKARTERTLGELFADTYEIFEKNFEKKKRETGKEIPDYRLRVTLIFEEGMGELASYPWEFLYVPRPNETGYFVAGMETGLILTRCVPPIIEGRQPTGKKMTIIVAWAQPRELGPVVETDAVVAIQALAAGIGEDLKGRNIEVIPLPQATHSGLQDEIKKENPQIVHFIGHGRIREGKSEIAFVKTKEQMAQARADLIKRGLRGEPEEANWVTSDSMRGLFQGAPPLLVFLHACNSAKAPESLETFKSVAEQVLRAKVPFVVAMQYEISNDDATDFAKTFYKNLGEGISIEEAVKAGRNELGKRSPAWGHPRFGTPVVYLQSEDSVIVSKKPEDGKVPEPLPQPPPPLLQQKCPYCTNIISPDQRRCSCEKRLRLKQCANPDCRKANRYEDQECLFCEFRFETEQPAQAPAGAPASAFTQSDRGAGQAERPAPSGTRP